MKNIIVFLFLLLPAISFNAEIPKFIQAQLFYSKFYSPEVGPYVETYLSVVGSSIEWQENEHGKLQGKVEVTMLFKDADSIVAFDKYELLSPEINDTADMYINFLDQQRFLLPVGNFDFEIRIRDLYGTSPPFTAVQALDIGFSPNETAISGIQLIESFTLAEEPSILTKSGYDLVPYVYNFIPQEVTMLSFYAEVYNTSTVLGNDQKFLLSYYIESFETGRQLSKFVSYKREDAKPVTVVFANYNIAELPSGNYNFVVEARNRDNEVCGEDHKQRYPDAVHSLSFSDFHRDGAKIYKTSD